MGSRRHPIYIDGPLEGQDFPVLPGLSHVQAIDYGKPGEWSSTLTADYVTYELRQFGFKSGGKAVSFWIASRSLGEPDAMTVVRALCKPELLGRVEVADDPHAARRS